MPLKLVPGQRGKDHLIHKGYRYKSDKVTNEGRWWECAFRNSRKCKGGCKTSGDEVIDETGDHNHAPSQAETKVTLIKAQ